jgi:hypothetical protein
MPTPTEDEVIRKLRERASRGELDGIDVTYRVTGGAPAEGVVDEEVQLSGPGRVKARVRTPATTLREASDEVPEAELKELLEKIGAGAGELIPRSEARFVPDSIVGQITVRVDGDEASFFFLPDEGQAEQHGQRLSPKAATAVESLTRLHKRLLQI